MSLSPELRGYLERRGAGCREAQDALDRLIDSACEDRELSGRLDAVMDHKAIRTLCWAAAELADKAAAVEFELRKEAP